MPKTKTMILQNNEGEEFFRHSHPDTRTNKQWVQFMNEKWGFNWGIGKRELKKIAKKKAAKKQVKKTGNKKAKITAKRKSK